MLMHATILVRKFPTLE